jgi:hypothetical protein
VDVNAVFALYHIARHSSGESRHCEESRAHSQRENHRLLRARLLVS